MTRPYEQITIAQVAEYPRPGTTVPTRVEFSPDGGSLTFLAAAAASLVRRLERHDLASGARSVVAGPPDDAGAFSRDEELRRERARLRDVGVTGYHYAAKASRPTLLIPGSPLARLVVDWGEPRPVDGTEGSLDPRLSPGGSHVAFVRDGDLHVVAVDGGAARRLTTGAEDGLTNGLAEFIAQEELDRSEGFWWSLDSRQIAFARADSRHIPSYPIVHQGKDTVEVEQHRYPFAGAPNAHVELGVVPAAGGEVRWMDLGPDRDVYLARVHWREDGTLVAVVLSRDQRSARVLAFDDDSRAATLLHEERGDPWLNAGDDLRFLRDGTFLLASERTGFRHLWLHDAAGRAIRQLTSGDWMVIGLCGVDEAARAAYLTGTCDGVLDRHLYRVSLDGGEPQRLTFESGWHTPVLSRDCAWLADAWSDREHAPRLVLKETASGRVRAVLHAQDEITATALGLQVPEPFDLPATDGSPLNGVLFRPPGGTPRPWPLIVSIYGGPHAQRVMNAWAQTVDMRAQYLAQQGYLVLLLDNRGSAGRGLAFEAHLSRRLGSVEIDDQVAAARALAARGDADPARTGVYGWSYGGYLACMALLRFPDVFRVAVAGAPVTHWDGYDTGYTERYMGTPQDEPDAYAESSLMTHVDRLEGRLLLVHGMLDENVHFRHTARLVSALIKAGKDYDLLLFPGERHMPRDATGLEYMERRIMDYFRAHL